MLKTIQNLNKIIMLAIFAIILSIGINVKAVGPESLSHELTIESFQIAPVDCAYSFDKVSLTAQASGGSGVYEYRFYTIRDGVEIQLKGFSEENTYTWTPYTVAHYEVYVEVRDNEGENAQQKLPFEVKNKELYVEFTGVSPTDACKSGGKVEISALARNGDGNYQYQFYVIRDNRKIILQKYSTVNTCVWLPYTVAEYTLGVEVIDASGMVASVSKPYNIVQTTLSVQNFVVDPEMAGVRYETINLTAQASGGSGIYEYCFYVIRDGRKIVLKDFSNENACLWTPYTVASYTVCVDVKDSYGDIVSKTYPYSVKYSNLTIDDFEVDPEKEAEAWNKVNISARASQGIGKYEYRFYVIRDGREIQLKNYSSENTYVWTPITIANYMVCVDVRDEAGTIITEQIDYSVTEEKLKILSLNAAEEGKIYVGNQQTISVSVSGGTKPLVCQFYVIRNGDFSHKIVLKDFSEELTTEWKPYTIAQYELFAVVKDATGTEVSKKIDLEVVPPKVEITNFIVGNGKIAQAYQKVNLSVEEKTYGAVGDLRYKYYVVRDGEEIILRDYNEVRSAIWTPYTPGKYKVCVAIQDGNGNVFTEEKEFEVVEQQVVLDSFYISVSDSVVPYTKINIEANGSGGTGELQYKFYVVRADKEIILKDYSTDNAVEWTPYTIAKYQVCVDIKDEQGLVVTGKKELVVLNKTCKGIDVSKYNGSVDWNSVKNQGIEFAMIRIGYGREINQKDPQFEDNYINARTNGLRVGIYHYSYATTAAEAKLEAKMVLSILNGRDLDLPIAFDIEDPNKHALLSKDQITEIVVAFCEEIKAAGYTPMVYSFKSLFNTKFDFSRMQGYKFWIASWGSVKPQIDGINTDMWQYSSTGNVTGANTSSGYCDMNYSYGL